MTWFKRLINAGNDYISATTRGADVVVTNSNPVIDPGKEKTVNEIVEEIHESFGTAADRLVAEAQAIIGEKRDDAAVALKSALGFKSAVGVAEHEKHAAEVEERQELMKHLLYFKQHYPNMKVISEKEAERICEKYNLVMGDVSRYMGDVPMKNLKEIEAFKNSLGRIKLEDKSYFMSCMGMIRPCSYSSYKNYKESRRSYASPTSVHEDNSFSICAPVKDMNMQGMKLEGRKMMRDIPDPVVLYPLRDGLYAIVSAWGPEASDVAVVNEKLN